MGFPNPSISAEATRRALVKNDESAASQTDASASRAALDAQELRDLERSMYQGAPSVRTGAGTDPPAAMTPARRRSLLDRLLRRG